VMLLYSGLEITESEMLAIRWHMGAWDLNFNSFEQLRSYDTAGSLHPLVSIIHAADTLALKIMEQDTEEIDDL